MKISEISQKFAQTLKMEEEVASPLTQRSPVFVNQYNDTPSMDVVFDDEIPSTHPAPTKPSPHMIGPLFNLMFAQLDKLHKLVMQHKYEEALEESALLSQDLDKVDNFIIGKLDENE